MFRKKVATSRREYKDRINWRSHEVTRIEAFSDAVFAFALTLLIVSLEVPKSFEELMKGMRSFIPFAICFALIFQVWMTQNMFFRRFGLNDDWTLILNAMLLFMVLFFVYPLKFLFSAMFLPDFAIPTLKDASYLFYIYGGGFSAIYLLFTALYWNALRQQHKLGLTPGEVFETKTGIYSNLLMASMGLTSIAMALFGGIFTAFAWVTYPLIGPVLGILYGRRGKIHRIKYETIVEHGDIATGT